MLVDFPLDEAAAAGGRLEAEGSALILGTALPELAHGIEAGPGVPPGALTESDFGARAESEQSAFRVGEERFPGQLAQLGQGR